VVRFLAGEGSRDVNGVEMSVGGSWRRSECSVCGTEASASVGRVVELKLSSLCLTLGSGVRRNTVGVRIGLDRGDIELRAVRPVRLV